MFAKPNALTAYGRVANAETDPIQQIVMLYDGGIKFLRIAADNIRSNDFQAKAEHTGRALDIINYLQTILDFERGGEVALALDKFYASITRMILRSSFALDAEMMDKSADLLVPMRDAWKVNAGRPASESLTANTFVGQNTAVAAHAPISSTA